MPIHADGVILPYKLQGQGKGVLQEVSIAGSPHTIRAEGPPPFGGTDSAPSPLDYVLAALVSCNQVTSQIVALGKNIKLGRFDGRVEAEFDNSVLVYGAEGNPNFSSIKLTVELETELEDAAFDEFVAEVARRCPVTQLITRSGVAFTSEWKNRTLVHS